MWRSAKGIVKEQGLEVELVSAGGSDRVGALVLADGVDFGLAGPEVPMYIYNGESTDKPLMFCALTGTDGLLPGVEDQDRQVRLVDAQRQEDHGAAPRLHAGAML